MAAMGEFGQKWCLPCTAAPKGEGCGLVIYNSLTRSKVPFVPMDPKGKAINMYICGPTVYDAAHLGHARTYIQFDVVRRLLRDVCGYDVTFVMNVTDVDDKIIMRSAERGVSSVALAREWESKFLRDMALLGVERPSLMPRVTEYVPEIVSFVAKIIERGVAYAVDGSVYFDTGAFAAQGHDYGKLVPESIGSAELMAEGEGKLAAAASAKKDAKDFALWKASKPGEPSWPSPWGAGRPGWHIECSAMIEATIGQTGVIDIHGGGFDLRFPHHDNELAQSEAHCGCAQSVNYFVHTGHLHIRGLKMSKSLKNFVTIDQALNGVVGESGEKEEAVRASTMRLMFCLVKYNAPCDYSDNMLAGARTIERKFKEYFHNVAAALRPLESDPDTIQKASTAEEPLQSAISHARAEVRARFLDDFDTPGAVLALQALVDATNLYLQPPRIAVPLVVAEAALVVADTLATLGVRGVVSDDLVAGLRFSTAHAQSSDDGASTASLAPLLDVLSRFRDDVRNAARGGATQKILELCDALRDDALPEMGVRLEDRGASSVWKLDDADVLRAERATKLAEERAKAELKAADMAKKEAKAAAAKVAPQDMFKNNAAYSAFDADGVPTHDAAKEPLSASGAKKLRKEWEKQKKLFEGAK
ncbi:tRNA synthetases class I (C) catalytic domain-containing protein [Pelagophyceae sp. CCMP2097]|nr:tRNA synthetases class I (C) catalytic domain-containing protein [Pelagophyceae sp. CCMP2097]